MSKSTKQASRLAKVMRERDTIKCLIGKAAIQMEEQVTAPLYLPSRVERLLSQLQRLECEFNQLTENGYSTDIRQFEGFMNNIAAQGVIESCKEFYRQHCPHNIP